MTSTTHDPIAALDAVNMELFDDVQFLREPRLRMLQSAFHCLRRTKQNWAEQGVFGAAGATMINPRWRISEALANSTLPRATLHDYQNDQVQLGLTLAARFQDTVTTHGGIVDAQEIPEGKPEWCDLNGQKLTSQVYVQDRSVWVLVPYDPLEHATLPVSVIKEITVHGGREVSIICHQQACNDEKAHNRALELAEMGRWALRQPRYCPA